jgi:hypothetical protein
MKGIPALTPVTSSNIEAIGHNGSRLFVRFKGGGLYSYQGVPEEVYREGLKMESVGSWFRASVRGHYPHMKHDA